MDSFLRDAHAALAPVTHLLGPSLGPLGRDYVLVSPTNQLRITSDGRAVLQALSLAHPVTRMVVASAATLDDGAIRLLLLVHSALARVVHFFPDPPPSVAMTFAPTLNDSPVAKVGGDAAAVFLAWSRPIERPVVRADKTIV